MKRYIFSMLVILLIVLYKPAYGDDCYDVTGCENIPWQTSTYGVQYPGYEECTLTVGIKWRFCGGTRQVKVAYIGFYDPFSNCDRIVKWLWPNDEWRNGQLPAPEKVDAIFDFCYEDVARQIMESAASSPSWRNMFDCDNPNPNYGEMNQVSMFKASCQSICWAYVEPSTHGDPYFWWSRSKCADLCCQKIHKYCWNSQTNSLQWTEEIVESPGQPDCSSKIPPACDWPDGNILFSGQGECMEDCWE